MDPTTLSNKILQINFTRFYWKFVVSTIILNSLVQEVEAYDPTLPKRHWTGEIWTQFLKIDFSLEKCNSSHISSPWPNFSTPTPFDSAPLFVTSYKPPWLHKKSPGSWHWFDWVCHAVAHECQDSKVTLISKPNQSCSLLTEKVPAASWTAPSLQHSSSADSWIAGGGVPSFFVFFRTRVYE